VALVPTVGQLGPVVLVILDVPFDDHGWRKTYMQGCRCILCKHANAKYMRDLRARRQEYSSTIPDWQRTNSLTWFDHAACQGHQTRLWFAGDGRNAESKTTRQAIAICLECPVIEECLTYALEMPTPWHGIYGGLTPSQRIAEYKRRYNRRPH